MLTFAARIARINSVAKTARAVSDADMDAFDKYRALHEYSWNSELPALIRDSAQAAEDNYFEQSRVLSALSTAVYHVTDAIHARPYLYPRGDGTFITIAGWLPNGEETSTDEAQALKMFAAYKAHEAFKKREDPKEVLPF